MSIGLNALYGHDSPLQMLSMWRVRYLTTRYGDAPMGNRESLVGLYHSRYIITSRMVAS
jgi:hypothetical protein